MRKSMIFIPGLIAISSLILLSGCDHSSNRNPIDKQDTPEDITDSVYKGSVFSLPAPMQIANQLRQFNPSYYVSYLVPPTGDAAKASCSAEDLAMILGILSVDLGYSVVYERQQAVLNYTAKVKKISDELGILGAFSPEVVQRIEANVNNIDSLVPVVLSSFNDVNEYFNDNDRQETGMLVLAGGMIEGLYISCQVALDMKDSLSRQVVGR
ncbi:MAG: hypothetical protein KJ607_03140, partial [Bacteroidetes bacterium]|nr:hypothetical protein [Bacteroidota bacterium]